MTLAYGVRFDGACLATRSVYAAVPEEAQGAMVGVIIGGVALLALVIALVFLCKRKLKLGTKVDIEVGLFEILQLLIKYGSHIS